MRRAWFRCCPLVAVGVLLAACAPEPAVADNRQIASVAYQLQGYPDGRLDQLAASPHQLVVIDLARDGAASYFTADEIATLEASGKKVLAYFEIGSIEDFRPEYQALKAQNGDLLLNELVDWPGEYFVRYWDPRWWENVVKPRVDQALSAGFDGVYLDTPLAYEEIDLDLVAGETRDSLGRKMVDLIEQISQHAKETEPGFWIFPQNSPELRRYSGYTDAIDGIGMEELYYLATDKRCDEDFCAANLEETRALRRAGKIVIAVDYATDRENIDAACQQYRTEGFAGTVTVLDLDQITPPCG